MLWNSLTQHIPIIDLYPIRKPFQKTCVFLPLFSLPVFAAFDVSSQGLRWEIVSVSKSQNYGLHLTHNPEERPSAFELSKAFHSTCRFDRLEGVHPSNNRALIRDSVYFLNIHLRPRSRAFESIILSLNVDKTTEKTINPKITKIQQTSL
jgi:hypothetical protein